MGAIVYKRAKHPTPAPKPDPFKQEWLDLIRRVEGEMPIMRRFNKYVG